MVSLPLYPRPSAPRPTKAKRTGNGGGESNPHPVLATESRITGSAPITELLRLTREGDALAQEYLFQSVFGELRKRAAIQLRRERTCELQPTELVNEAYIHLFGEHERIFNNRAHFLAVAARAMYCVLIDLARKRRTTKRGRAFQQVNLSEWIPDENEGANWAERFIFFNEVMQQLKQWDPIAAQVIEMKLFVGSTDEEIAEAIGKCTRTVKRDYKAAKAWLQAAFHDSNMTDKGRSRGAHS